MSLKARHALQSIAPHIACLMCSLYHMPVQSRQKPDRGHHHKFWVYMSLSVSLLMTSVYASREKTASKTWQVNTAGKASQHVSLWSRVWDTRKAMTGTQAMLSRRWGSMLAGETT